jgi:hypothetical protein
MDETIEEVDKENKNLKVLFVYLLTHLIYREFWKLVTLAEQDAFIHHGESVNKMDKG